MTFETRLYQLDVRVEEHVDVKSSYRKPKLNCPRSTEMFVGVVIDFWLDRWEDLLTDDQNTTPGTRLSNQSA